MRASLYSVAQMRLLPSLTTAGAIVCLAVPGAACAKGVSSLTKTPPSFLHRATTPARTHPSPAASGQSAHGSLPRTGDDLEVELLAAAGLLGTGFVLRLRLR